MGAVHVKIKIQSWIFFSATDADQACEMDDRAGLVQFTQLVEQTRFANVASLEVELRVIEGVAKIAELAGTEIVNRDHFSSGVGEQSINGVAADKAGGTGNEDGIHKDARDGTGGARGNRVRRGDGILVKKPGTFMILNKFLKFPIIMDFNPRTENHLGEKYQK